MSTQTQVVEGKLLAAGISVERIDDDLSSLTVDLRNVIAADALAKLLKSLSDLYSVGVGLDNPRFEVWLDIHGQLESSRQLIISELIIGTPNKLRVSGRKHWITTLAAILGALATLAGKYVELQKPTAESDAVHVHVNVNPHAQPIPRPPAGPTLSELMDAIGKDNALLGRLDADYNAGKITLSDYVIRRDLLESALKDARQAFHIVCASSQSGPAVAGAPPPAGRRP